MGVESLCKCIWVMLTSYAEAFLITLTPYAGAASLTQGSLYSGDFCCCDPFCRGSFPYAGLPLCRGEGLEAM